ncbi:MAG: TlyA family RNA methyltransferase [Anaerolineae bacterium]|nr:TlyA family RNA methyltransferase [Anaerolineae bacterium]
MASKTRIDILLVDRELVSSRSEAQRLIMAGEVAVNGQPVTKPGALVLADSEVKIAERLPYVSRGGLKLAAALDAFAVDVGELIAADVGASTGGFTDCLLQRGIARVYAIDVGYGQLAWPLRQDERVVVMERTNARYLESLPEPIDLATIDASFISLTLLLPCVRDWLKQDGQVIALIKPQFEAGKDQVGKGGVVRDRRVHREVLERILTWCSENGLPPQGLIRSPITGPAGNVEFLVWLHKSSQRADRIDQFIKNAL